MDRENCFKKNMLKLIEFGRVGVMAKKSEIR